MKGRVVFLEISCTCKSLCVNTTKHKRYLLYVLDLDKHLLLILFLFVFVNAFLKILRTKSWLLCLVGLDKYLLVLLSTRHTFRRKIIYCNWAPPWGKGK